MTLERPSARLLDIAGVNLSAREDNMDTQGRAAYGSRPAAVASVIHSGADARREGRPTVRSFFGLAGSGMQGHSPPGAPAYPENDGSLQGLMKTAVEDALAVSCLYAIVVFGRGLTTPGATSVFRHSDFWVWVALLVVCNAFLQVFYPALKQQLVQASVFSVMLVLMSPIKTRELVSPGEG